MACLLPSTVRMIATYGLHTSPASRGGGRHVFKMAQLHGCRAVFEIIAHEGLQNYHKGRPTTAPRLVEFV